MENTNLNILTIQNNPSDIDKALAKIVNPATNILYTNISSKLTFGEQRFKIEYDTAIYSEENDLLILIMRGLGITEDEIIRKLDERAIPFTQITLSTDGFKDYDEEIKEICFAKDASALKEFLKDSKQKGNDVCRYYPVMRGKLSLMYPGKHYLAKDCSEKKDKIEFDCQELRGMMETEDRIVFLVNNQEDHNVYYKQALKILSETGMTPIIEDYETFRQQEKAKQKVNKKEDQ